MVLMYFPSGGNLKEFVSRDFCKNNFLFNYGEGLQRGALPLHTTPSFRSTKGQSSCGPWKELQEYE